MLALIIITRYYRSWYVVFRGLSKILTIVLHVALEMVYRCLFWCCMWSCVISVSYFICVVRCCVVRRWQDHLMFSVHVIKGGGRVDGDHSAIACVAEGIHPQSRVVLGVCSDWRLHRWKRLSFWGCKYCDC